MRTENALAAQQESYAPAPAGLRRLTLGSVEIERLAEDYDGLPASIDYRQVLAAFKAAAPRLGLAPRLVHAIDWLFNHTRPQDWNKGSRPIVWPSSSLQQEVLGISRTQAKALNRTLVEAGLIVMRDSANGKRYGTRDAENRIVEAYGFDLSPLAIRYEELTRAAHEARADRAVRKRLDRRSTIAYKGICQILELARMHGSTDTEWATLRRKALALRKTLPRVSSLEELTIGVESLERRLRLARERLAAVTTIGELTQPDGVGCGPRGPENRPHKYTYKPSLYRDKDTVAAANTCPCDGGRAGARPGPAQIQDPHPGRREGEASASFAQADFTQTRERGRGADRPTVAELLQMAPLLGDHLTTTDPRWDDIVVAAHLLAHSLGISQRLWTDACKTMGSEGATITLAVVLAKPSERIRSTPAAYFCGMVKKAQRKELHLAPTLWGIRASSRKHAG